MAVKKHGARTGFIKAADQGARKVASTFGKTAHFTLPGKNQAYVVESAAERLATDAFSIDPEVKAYVAQPYTVDLIDGVLLRSVEERRAASAKHAANGVESSFYTLDFDVEWMPGTHSGVEVKAEGYPGDALYQEKLAQAREILWAHGIEFLYLVIPGYWRHPLRSNLPLLHQAKLRDDHSPTAATISQVESLASAGAATLQDFCSGLGFDNRMAPVLIVHGVLDVDFLQHPLMNSTPASPAHGSLDHLRIVRRLAQ